MARGKKRQLELGLPATWGGKRKGAGRKPSGEQAGISHMGRPRLGRRMPVHVTLRVTREVYNLRSKRCFKRIETAFYDGGNRFGLRLNQFSVQGNHLHLVVEAEDNRALSRGMQGLEIRMAKALNKLMQRRGRVFADRYHAHVLRTPTEVKNALHYVVGNYRNHALKRGKPISPIFTDDYSSLLKDDARTHPPQTWLLRSALKSARSASGPPPGR